jgi:ATP-dependent helicase/nuclease subunit A
VHGAKGLEAPVVILPDTMGRPPALKAQLLRTGEESQILLASLGRSADCAVSKAARTAAEGRAFEEQHRLLYVALTRARDRLIVTGRAAAGRSAPDGSWRGLIEAAFARRGAEVRRIESPFGAVLRYGADPALSPTVRAPAPPPAARPAWLGTSAAAGSAPERPARAAPTLEADGAPALSPLARAGGLGRFRRGVLVHRLLQLLPGHAPQSRRAAGQRLLEKEVDLPPAVAEEIIEAVLGVVEDRRFQEVFQEGSRAEAALAGTVPGLGAVSGRVDRLLVAQDRVLVVDFKSNRPSPDRAEDVEEGYLAQMAVYVALLRQVFPGRAVEAALVWTDGPKLTVIPDELLRAALARRIGGD